MSDELRTDRQIKADVDAGLRWHAVATAAAEELKLINARLKADALQRPEEHTALHEAEREGTQWLAPGGLIIICSADSLSSDMERGSDPHHSAIAAIAAAVKLTQPEAHAACDEVDRIWLTLAEPWLGFVKTERDGLAYRQKVRELLPEPHATAFIEAWKSRDKDGLPKNAISAEWDALHQSRNLEAVRKELAKLDKAAAKKGATK